MNANKISIESWNKNKPNSGKVFAAIFPHSDDFTFFACGTMLKMIEEGYRGYFIRITNDEKDSYDLSVGQTICEIEKETQELSEFLGIEKVYDFNYKNHYLDYTQLTEIRHRLIILFRFLKIDTIISFDPWGHYEENPDHYITAKAVESACWMAGRQLDLPELKDIGLEPHFVTQKYYVARGPQLTNKIINIEMVLEKKISAINIHRTPIDNMWKVYLDENHNRPDKLHSIEQFIEQKLVNGKSDLLEGVRYYEKFHYIGPED